MAEYDIVIIGGGAAGLTAGLYLSRAGLPTLLLEKSACGGQMLITEEIENYPGFPEGIKGPELAERIKSQACRQGLRLAEAEATQIALVRPTQTTSRYIVKTQDNYYQTYSIILACGAHPKRLGLPREELLTGKGVSYCATCDGPLFRGKNIVVVGGGNAACEEALYLSRFAARVTLIHRRRRLRADKVYQERLKANPKIELIWNSVVLEILGEKQVSGVQIEDVTTAKKGEISCCGVFIFTGLKPNTDFIKGLVQMDSQGFIVTAEDLATSRRGIFACGDCRRRALPQIITACGEGALAAKSSRDYVEELKGTAYKL